MRRFLSPRWLALHLLTALAFAACLGMSWWQLSRAQGGNAISWGYTFEWPVFGLFAIAFWGKLIRDERRGAAGDTKEPDRVATPVLAGAALPARIQRVERVLPDVDDVDDPELAAYNRYLAWQNANPHRSRRDFPG